jgi:tRNA (mo5U34)-methyltransferase
MDISEKRRGASEHTWYHTIDLGDGVVTDGQYDHRPLVEHYGLPDDLTGKSVLDVGPAHGYFAFELEARGAARVVTAELPRWSAHDGSDALKEQFDREGLDKSSEAYLHGALGFAVEARNSSVEQQFCNVYDLSPETVGTFDVVFCGSMLIHITDPLRALFAIRSVTRELAILATTVNETRWSRAPRARFVGQPEGQTFWEPNMACLQRWALAAGFARAEAVSMFRLRSVDGRFDEPHGTVHAHVV